jgi:hypothetical protein
MKPIRSFICIAVLVLAVCGLVSNVKAEPTMRASARGANAPTALVRTTIHIPDAPSDAGIAVRRAPTVTGHVRMRLRVVSGE